MRRDDNDIEAMVEHELDWDPAIHAEGIAVQVKDGVVTLAGFAKSYLDKSEAERVAKRVRGVKSAIGGKRTTAATTAVGCAAGAVSFVCVRLTPTSLKQTLRPLAAPEGHLSRQLVLPSRVTQMSGGWLC